MNYINLILVVFGICLLYILFIKKENMSNTDIKKTINEIYQADIQSIRNLSKLANDLTNNGKLRVPGGLEIDGKLTVKDVSNFKKLVTIENAELQVTHKNKGTTHFNHQNKGTNYIRGTNLSIDTSDTNISSKLVNMTKGELRIKNGKNGKTHFNYLNRGTNYIRGGFLNIDTSNTNITKGIVNMTNAELRIRNGKNGTTHFNYQNKGLNYIRGGQLNIDTITNNMSKGLTIRGNLHTLGTITGNGTVTAKYIRGKRGQFGKHGYLLVGEHRGRGFITARSWGCWYHSSDASMRKLTPHKSKHNCSFVNHFTV